MAQNQKTKWKKPLPKEAVRQQVIDKTIQKQEEKIFNIPRLLFFSLLATLIVYIPSLFNDFVTNWDDGGYIHTDDAIQTINFENLKIIFTRFYKGNYHPLTTLVYAIEYQLVGLNAFLYHLVNLVFHLLNVWLVYSLIMKLFKRAEIAFITALLFGIHPMHVESVAWISELKDVMYAFFFLQTTLLYIEYQDEGSKIGKKYFLSIFLFFLSLMSKSAAVSLPVTLIAIDLLRSKKFTIKSIADKLPFFALSFAFGIIAILSQDKAGAIQDLDPLFTWGQRAFLASYAVMMYIARLFVPFQLSTMHPYPELNAGNLPKIYYIAPLVPIVLLLSVLFTYKKTKVVWFGLLYFFLTIALVLQILPVGGAIIAERYTYIPYIGIFLIFGWLYTLIADKKPKYKNLTIAILAIFCISMSVKTVYRISVWKRGDALFTDVTEKYPNMPFGYNNLGFYYYSKLTDPKKPQNPYTNFKGQKVGFDYVEELYTKCLTLDPRFHSAYSNRGVLYFNTGREAKAVEDFTKALEIKPTSKDALLGRANSLSKLNRFKESLADYYNYLKVEPKDDKAWEWLGTAYYRIAEKDNSKNKQKYLDTAILRFNQTLTLNPENSQALYFRGLSYYMIAFESIKTNANQPITYEKLNTEQKQIFEKAIADFNEAYKINPTNTEPMTWKAFTYYRLNKYPETVEAFTYVIDKNPLDPFARLYRGKSYYQLKKFNEALMDFSVIVDKNPQDFENLESQAHAFFELKKYREALRNMEVLRRVPNRPFDVKFYNEVLQKAR